MTESKKILMVLMAEDDDDYYFLAREAFEKVCCEHQLYRVEDGEELMAYLRSKGKYKGSIMPDVILLDLNMPRKNGRQALQEIKADPKLSQLPVVILTTSKSERDIYESYQQGAHSYIWKPIGFQQLVDVFKIFCQYWSQTIELPHEKKNISY